MTALLDIDRLIARVREEAERPEYQPPVVEPLQPQAAPASSSAFSTRLASTPALPLEPASIRSVDDLLLVTDPERFVDLAYRTLLRRPPDPTGGGYYRERLTSGFGQPFVLAALRASDEARVLKAPPLPGFGLAPLVYILWRYGRGAGLGVPGRWVNLAYHHWRQLRLAFTGRLAAHGAHERERLAAQLQALHQRLEDAHEVQVTQRAELDRRLDRLAHEFEQARESHARQLTEVSQTQRTLRADLDCDLGLLGARLKLLHQRLHSAPPRPVPASSAAPSSEDALAARIDDYYLAFEERHRGEERDIRADQRRYLDELARLPEALLARPVLDIGSGRGEWLNLLREQGFTGIGVDLSAAMAEQARRQGLDVRQGDALTLLAEQPDDSLAALTAFHVIEHLPFETLFQLLEQAWRALAPGGRLLLETPNPENVLVGSHTFYHDFSHRHPITPTALRFLCAYHGFAEIRLQRLHPYPPDDRLSVDSPLADRLNAHLYGPQDYALIAAKPLVEASAAEAAAA